MPWIQVALQTDAAHCEACEEALMVAGALSVTETDNADQPLLEPGPGETPLWDQVTIVGLFTADTDIDQVRNALATALGAETAASASVTTLADQEWTRAWMDHFQPMSFGTRLWVCPQDQSPPEPDAINLLLDPGLAFGTGTHQTTALCLQWLDAHDVHKQRVLDYGCGSGILAIAALLLGARHATGVDNDEQALQASRNNASNNQVSERLDLYLPEQQAAGVYDVILANILAAPLMELAPQLAGQVRPGGHIVLSGILAEQAAEVSSRYEPWFIMNAPVVEAEWCRLDGVRRQPA